MPTPTTTITVSLASDAGVQPATVGAPVFAALTNSVPQFAVTDIAAWLASASSLLGLQLVGFLAFAGGVGRAITAAVSGRTTVRLAPSDLQLFGTAIYLDLISGVCTTLDDYIVTGGPFNRPLVRIGFLAQQIASSATERLVPVDLDPAMFAGELMRLSPALAIGSGAGLGQYIYRQNNGVIQGANAVDPLMGAPEGIFLGERPDAPIPAGVIASPPPGSAACGALASTGALGLRSGQPLSINANGQVGFIMPSIEVGSAYSVPGWSLGRLPGTASTRGFTFGGPAYCLPAAEA